MLTLTATEKLTNYFLIQFYADQYLALGDRHRYNFQMTDFSDPHKSKSKTQNVARSTDGVDLNRTVQFWMNSNI